MEEIVPSDYLARYDYDRNGLFFELLAQFCNKPFDVFQPFLSSIRPK